MYLSEGQSVEPLNATARARVLVVDDQLQMLLSVQALLRLKGFCVRIVTDGDKALSCLRKEHFDIVLIDLKMPGLTGLEVLRSIRDLAPECAVVVVSAHGSLENIKQAMKLGAFDFLRKPYDPEALIAAVELALNERQQQLDLKRSDRRVINSELMHRFIVNHSPDFIYILDKRGNFSYVNEKVEALVGYKRHELIGGHFSTIIHSHNADEAYCCFNEQRTGARATENFEMRLKVNPNNDQVSCLSSKERIVELNAVGLYDRRNGEKDYTGTLGCVRDISARKQNEAQLSFQAYHDLLTRLPNRALFDDRIKQAFAHSKRNNEKFALILMDLDRFKQVNDTFGHALGDRVLQQVAERILACLRAEDTLCRFGGDEFTLLLPGIASREGTITVVEKVLKAIRQPFEIDDHQLYLSISMGIAIYPEDGESQEALLRSADIAMYQVKADGKDGYFFYSDDLAGDSTIFSAERDLYQALENQQFQVFFQPKVDPVRHVIVGMEALLRWQHPQHGLLYPEDFLDLAEESRLIVPIGAWVIRNVCSELLRWRKQGLPKIRVSLNISPVQLAADDFVGDFIRILEEFRLPGELFAIEITEKGLASGNRDIVDRLNMLSDYGISVTLDDFGRGFSSLSCLKNAPVDTLKIDRTFVREIGGTAPINSIVEGIALLASGLCMNLIAEGVENHTQLDYLAKLGCREVQGYLYAAPVSASDTLTFLLNRPQDGPHFNFH